MQILVTGAAGFIGSHLVERLLEVGATVLGLDCFDDFYDPAVKRENLLRALELPGFRLIEGDIRDQELLREAIPDPIDCIEEADVLIGPLVVPPVGSGYLDPEVTSPLVECLTDFNEMPGGNELCDAVAVDQTDWGLIKATYR